MEEVKKAMKGWKIQENNSKDIIFKIQKIKKHDYL